MNDAVQEHRRIVVITKLNTPNVGNQALSTELMRLAQRVHGQHELVFLGRPSGLEKYSVKKLENAGEGAVSLFDEWAEEIIRSHQLEVKPPARFRQGSAPAVNLLRPDSASIRLKPLKRPLRRARAALRHFRSYQGGYGKRLQLLRASDLVVYNPAGEMNRVMSATMWQLLELHAARKLGCRVMVINHSVEIQDPWFCRLLAHLYTGFDGIVVREYLSRQALVDMGVPEEKVRVAPDAALLATAPEDRLVSQVVKQEAIGPGTVAVAINSHTSAEELTGWGKVIQRLQESGKEVIFVSNCLAADRRIALELRRRHGVRIMSQQYDYPEYIGLLSGVELVISSRLHTCVFAMLGITPVIPVEPNVRKVTGLFQLANYPVSTINLSTSCWVEDVLRSVAYIYTNYGAVQRCIERTVAELRAWAEENVRWDTALWSTKGAYSE